MINNDYIITNFKLEYAILAISKLFNPNKNTMKTLKILSLIFFVGLLATSCGGDDDDNNSNVDCNSAVSITASFQAETEAWTNALQAYSNDPSTANCNAYKTAYLEWLNAVRALESCYNEAGLGVEWQQSIDDAEAAINALVC